MPLPGWVCPLNQEYVSKAVGAFAKFERETNRLLLNALDFQLNEDEILKVWANFYEGFPDLKRQVDKLLNDVTAFSQDNQRQQASK